MKFSRRDLLLLGSSVAVAAGCETSLSEHLWPYTGGLDRENTTFSPPEAEAAVDRAGAGRHEQGAARVFVDEPGCARVGRGTIPHRIAGESLGLGRSFGGVGQDLPQDRVLGVGGIGEAEVVAGGTGGERVMLPVEALYEGWGPPELGHQLSRTTGLGELLRPGGTQPLSLPLVGSGRGS